MKNEVDKPVRIILLLVLVYLSSAFLFFSALLLIFFSIFFIALFANIGDVGLQGYWLIFLITGILGLISGVFLFFIGLGIQKNKTWSRYALIVFLAIFLFQSLHSLIFGLGINPLGIILLVLDLVVLYYLIFTKEAKDYFISSKTQEKKVKKSTKKKLNRKKKVSKKRK